MSAKLEWTLVAVLGAGGLAVYFASERRAAPAAETPAPAAVTTPRGPADLSPFSDPTKPTAPPLPWLATTSHSEGLPTSGAWRGHPALADMNGDGRLDILAAIRRIDHSTAGEGLFIFLGDGAGQWTPSVGGLRRDMGYGGVAVADVNNDGHLDLAYSGHDVVPHVFVGGDPSGQWLQSWSAYDLDGICSDVALGDIDGDGNADLVTIALFSAGDGIVAFKGDGQGVFEKWQVLEPTGSYGHSVEITDVDGDSRNEVLAVTSDGMRVWSFDGAWENHSQGLPKPEVGGSELDVVAVDLDADGYKELVIAGMIYPGHPPLRAWRWDGSAWAPWGSGLSDGEGFSGLALANLGPGAPISLIALGTFGTQLIQLEGPGQFVARGRLQGAGPLMSVACGDIDGDGRDEVLCVGHAGVSVLKITEKSFASATPGAVR